MSKPMVLRCSQSMCERLSEIFLKYADAAYPKGGSECAQSARESLLTSADALLVNWDEKLQTTQISKRLRVMAKSAIKYYAESLTLEEDLPSNARLGYLLSVLSGDAINEAGYHAVQQADRTA